MWSLAVCALFALDGCAHLPHWPRKHTEPPEKPETPAADARHRLVGTIVLVDETKRFVLIDVGGYAPPETGRALKTFAGDDESGVLAVSAERRPPFVVADIVKGEPRRGDSVFE